MSGILTYAKAAGLAAVLACGMAAFPQNALAYGSSQASIRKAQQQLKGEGYYKGTVDGIDGPMTRAAIRKYQSDQNLTVSGRLDQQTRSKLGMGTASGEASRSQAESSSTTPANQSQTENNAIPTPTSATISAAQRSLQKKGFYKGDLNGNMGSETRAAIREYQKSSNLNVTGKLDPATLSSLGVSK